MPWPLLEWLVIVWLQTDTIGCLLELIFDRSKFKACERVDTMVAALINQDNDTNKYISAKTSCTTPSIAAKLEAV